MVSLLPDYLQVMVSLESLDYRSASKQVKLSIRRPASKSDK